MSVRYHDRINGGKDEDRSNVSEGRMLSRRRNGGREKTSVAASGFSGFGWEESLGRKRLT